MMLKLLSYYTNAFFTKTKQLLRSERRHTNKHKDRPVTIQVSLCACEENPDVAGTCPHYTEFQQLHRKEKI